MGSSGLLGCAARETLGTSLDEAIQASTAGQKIPSFSLSQPSCYQETRIFLIANFEVLEFTWILGKNDFFSRPSTAPI